MPGQNAQTAPLVKVPQPQRLIVTSTQYPRELGGIGVKLDGADVVQVAEEGEEAATELVVPDFDFVVISAGDDEGLVEVKVHAADGTIVFLETIDDGAHAVVPSA